MSEPQIGEELVRLASADNFRDVAGSGHPTADGGRVRRGVLFRSNELQLTDADAHSLGGLGITAVYDLRGAREVEAHPDVPVPGAAWHHLAVGGIPMDEVAALTTGEKSLAAMHRVYRAFVEEPDARAAFGALLTRVATTDGAQLFHCTAGKDRTGWAAAVVLGLLGVPDEVVVEDYLLTNTFSSATREKYLGLIRENLGPDKVEVYEAVMVADEAYLRTAYDAVAASYGDLRGYALDGLGVAPADLGALLDRLRE
ncbi:protein-tyrosine-phosphatase [Nocardioides sp. zg-579]|uniref:Protein-tyrosine-phosphatase n=1 Tax=Nocardioides marmotae TaxID=2663857 RepID=A0A6I3JF03_9ACTN|nr:tyrosine-protein phosphatase [Nocardioides marmotae]MCR6033037.1 protein-tyrosine-phosphatase [Gordonia jinghuaiqii]MTB96689.1 protein-tyrosine-phosphatase [Nocardioides marmotae]QKE03096.1 tyrosine-protein phosphatase [Nocardioides marmotae]